MTMMEAPELLQPEAASRYDIYQLIHKALRARMARVLVRLGALDVADPQDLQAGLDELDALLAQCASHVQHEDEFLHPVLQRLNAGSADEAAEGHLDHQRAIAALQAASTDLRTAPQPASALRLYRQFALFVAENLVHMQHEETWHNAVLWRHCTDAQILEIEQRLHASLPPAEMADVLPWMTTGLNPAERAALFGGLQAQLPPEAFTPLMHQVRQRLDDRAWTKLSKALQLPPQPWHPAF